MTIPSEGVEPVKLDAKALEALLEDLERGCVATGMAEDNSTELFDVDGASETMWEAAQTIRALSALSPVSPSPAAEQDGDGIRDALIELVIELGRWDRWVIGNTQGERTGADIAKAKMIERLKAIIAASPIAPRTSEPVVPERREQPDWPPIVDLGRVLGFFASCIKSGEAWSPTCQAEYDRANRALQELYSTVTATPQPDTLREAARDLIASRFDTYRAGNNRQVGIQDDNGEKCWIVPFDEMAALEAALKMADTGNQHPHATSAA